jgi:hypothetical protein
MKTLEAHVGPPVVQPHEVEIDRQTVAAFWRLGRVLVNNAPRDREVFTLGRCIGNTSGITSALQAFGERDDPSSFPLARLIYGGDQPMLDAYWQSAENPVVFDLARQVYRLCPEPPDHSHEGGDQSIGVVIFDISAEHARLAGLRFSAA